MYLTELYHSSSLLFFPNYIPFFIPALAELETMASEENESAGEKRPRNQSEIALKWWAKKRLKTEDFLALTSERDRLLEEIEQLKAEKESLTSAAESIVGTLTAELNEGNSRETQHVISVVNNYGGFRKITDKRNRVLAVGTAIVALLSVLMTRTHPITRLRTICEAVFDNAIFGIDVTKVALSELYKKYFFAEQRERFAPWKVLKAIDLSSVGGLNYNGIEALRTLEGLGLYERGVLPSRSQIQRASYELHDIGQTMIPFCKKESQYGEMFQYDYEKFIRFILKTFQLSEVAQRETIELCITLDGVELCTVNHEHFGRIFANQSRNYCFAMKSLIGKDSKVAYKEFSDFFRFFERLKKHGLPASDLGPAILPMDIWSPQDLSSIWKCLNTGSGARKNGNTHFCHICACTGNSIVRYLVDENRYSSSLFISFILFVGLFESPCFPFFTGVVFVSDIIRNDVITGL
jgi:hypothetical protein